MTRTAAATVRDVTDEEIAHYRENGWAKLDAFITPELAGELLAGAQAAMGGDQAPERDDSARSGRWAAMGGRVQDIGYWHDLHFIARDLRVEPFVSLVYSPAIGRAAQRFVRRDVPIRYSTDLLACKMPAGQTGSAPTAWHQDIASLPFDRVGPLTFWFALNDLPPERGTMRFLSGSQRAGNLGRTRAQGKGTIEYYPELLDEFEMSAPLHLAPGDATVHNAAVVHGAPENSTAEPRWGLIVAYFPADVLWTGAPHHNYDRMDLEVNQPIDHPSTPVVYPA